MLADTAIQTSASRSGIPVTSSPTAHTTPAARNWPHSARNRSALPLTRRFHPACSTAASSANAVAVSTSDPNQRAEESLQLRLGLGELGGGIAVGDDAVSCEHAST